MEKSALSQPIHGPEQLLQSTQPGKDSQDTPNASHHGGHIHFCLKNNIPVVLSEDSKMYHYYPSEGFTIFTLKNNKTPDISLKEEERRSKQEKLDINFGQNNIAEQYRNLLSCM